MLLLALFLSAVLAFAISTVAGGGAGLMLMPVLALLLPGAQVPAALSIGTAVSSFSRIAMFWRSIRWDVVRWFLPAALPAAALGAWLLSRFEPVYVKLILGLFLTANLPLLFLRQRAPEPVDAPAMGPRGLLLLGAAVGLLSGFTGAVGVAFNRFYFRLRLQKGEIVATRATNEVLLHLLKLALYAAFGLLTDRAIMAGAVVAIAAVCASWLMKHAIAYVADHVFRHAGTAAMVAAGLGMVGTAAPAALARNDAGLHYHANSDEREMQAHWGRHAYAVALSRRSGIVLEKKLDLARLKPKYRRFLPPTPNGARVVAIEKIEQIDREGLEIHYAQGGREWSRVVITED
ncbi:MAG TPA: sulfite exporter TauE/SafE family protein [Novosphingobium sp.]|nr:sulfite exporter TauE/SafE family protein [Novosphingobium sp.]